MDVGRIKRRVTVARRVLEAPPVQEYLGLLDTIVREVSEPLLDRIVEEQSTPLLDRIVEQAAVPAPPVRKTEKVFLTALEVFYAGDKSL